MVILLCLYHGCQVNYNHLNKHLLLDYCWKLCMFLLFFFLVVYKLTIIVSLLLGCLCRVRLWYTVQRPLPRICPNWPPLYHFIQIGTICFLGWCNPTISRQNWDYNVSRCLCLDISSKTVHTFIVSPYKFSENNCPAEPNSTLRRLIIDC